MDMPRNWRAALAAVIGACTLAACGGGSGDDCGYGTDCSPGNGGSTAGGYTASALVSDTGGSAYRDANLVNGWGVAFNPNGYVWVANAGTSTSTLYDGHGVPQSLVVRLPAGQRGAAQPTGIVFNATPDFVVSAGGGSGASAFLFAGKAGTLAGWSPAVSLDMAVTAYDGGGADKVYTGLAIAAQGAANRLYAVDFHHARIDVFDARFQPVALPGGFTDGTLPAGYAPFGIQAIGNLLYVTYAMQDADSEDEVAGTGLGAVNVYDTAGQLVRRLVAPGGALDAPWGVAMAPAGFGKFGGALLVGNFGDGRINAYDATNGTWLGALSRPDGTAIVIDGLWGIAFGNGLNDQPTNTLFYAAGPADEAHGVYGRIDSR